MHKRLPLFAVLVVLFAVVVTGCNSQEPVRIDEGEWRAASVEPPYEKPLGSVLDTSGKPFDIRKQTDDLVTLFYIGYTHCPDICPTHFHDMSAALSRVSPDVAKQVRVIFITADPDRDTGPELREWLDHFNTDFIGLVPTEQELAELLDGLSMKLPVKTDIGNGNYTVSHAAYVIAFTKDGVGGLVYPSGITIADWVHDLPRLVKVKG